MFDQILLLQSGGGSNQILTMIVWMMILLVGYFFLIRPQSKKAKLQDEFTQTMDKGDMVVTNGGIHGKITKLDEHTVTLLVDNKTYMVMERAMISLELSNARYSKPAVAASSK